MSRSIDMFNHFLPQAFYDKVIRLGGRAHMLDRAQKIPAMSNLDYRLRLMDTFEGYQQVPCIVSPNVEQLVAPEHTAELARVANEAFYNLCQTYPEKFPSFSAVLPLDDLDKACKEAEYAITQLGAAGVQIFTNHQGQAIDSPEYFKLYDLLNDLQGLLWIHPSRTFKQPYYKGEEYEKYELWWTLMWPIETAMAAARLVYSGIFQKCPKLNIILHHAGGMLPMLEGRLENGLKLYGTRTAAEFACLTESPVQKLNQIDEFKKFIVDSATFGSRAAIECAINFFGVDHLVFASDLPFDPEDGFGYVRRTLKDIDELSVGEKEKNALRFGNALKLLRKVE